jgi:D-erythro-7,8-dihydroneopterin triphosphate epimerase
MRVKLGIKDLALRTVIGLNEWERDKKQDVLINITLEYESGQAIEQDSPDHGVDYKALTKRVIERVENSSFHMLEALACSVLQIVMEEPRVLRAAVKVDKPHSLRFAESVSAAVEASREK